MLSGASNTATVKLIVKVPKVPGFIKVSSRMLSDQSPLICSPANVDAKVPPSGSNVPVNGAEPVIIPGAPSINTVFV